MNRGAPEKNSTVEKKIIFILIYLNIYTHCTVAAETVSFVPRTRVSHAYSGDISAGQADTTGSLSAFSINCSVRSEDTPRIPFA